MSSNSTMAETSGSIDFTYNGETFKIWYKVVGDLRSARPLVTLHGGPGIPHNYMLPHAELATARDIPVVFYDQVGIGHSTHLRAKPATFWIVELFIAELENVLAHLGIASDFDLLGHSWGGMLAAEYAIRVHSAGLKHLILTDSLASMELWAVSVHKLLKQLPEDLQETLRRHEEDGTTDSKEYQEGMSVFYGKHICRLDPWPQDMQDAFAFMAEDPTVYTTMIGPSEFNITGTLKTWSVIDKLPTVRYPTLVMNGVHDEAQDECVRPFFERIPKVRWVQFAESSHVPFFEEKERYFSVLGDFLKL
ncbi:hypothetical protein EWM64_g8325 [Hericium alpestre]|uniref:AB hydrolase-1 domain-containing protein n=1 Tax=Hericium alpestre TaxID=135208 RepID=A0A4Y9ZQB5_9AGAM|nr:hypothetical protein EWM64_g8325 [Hericium alpestre]